MTHETVMAETYTATLQLVCGSKTETITGTFEAGADTTIYYPACYKETDGYYVIAQNKNTPYYGISLNLQKDTTITLTYTLDPTIVYYDKYKDICGYTSGTALAKESSLGHSDYLGSNSSAITGMSLTSEGYYNVTLAGGNRYARDKEYVSLLYDDTEDEIQFLEYDSSEYRVVTIDSVLIGEDQELMISNSTSNDYFAGDYIIVREAVKTVNVKCTNSETLMCTYSNSTQDLKFPKTGAVKAYVATEYDSEKDSVTLTQITDVPKNTGVVLKADSKDNMTVIAIVSSGSYTGTNLLNATDGSNTIKTTDNTNYAYILSSGLFYALDTDYTINSGLAYLWIPREPKTESSAKGVGLIFSDSQEQETGIRSVKSAVKNGKVYNLQGVEVKNPTSGLYIINGRKVIK